MREVPMLFNTEMVKAILAGNKTQTRRLVKPQPVYNNGFWELGGAGWSETNIPIYPVPGHSLWERQPVKPGDVLWVRETWAEMPYGYVYRADGDPEGWDGWDRWRPSIHMQRKAARLFLRVKDVRIERLRNMSADDCAKDGGFDPEAVKAVGIAPLFGTLWDSTVKKADLPRYGWEASPWVWVIEFEKVEK